MRHLSNCLASDEDEEDDASVDDIGQMLKLRVCYPSVRVFGQVKYLFLTTLQVAWIYSRVSKMEIGSDTRGWFSNAGMRRRWVLDLFRGAANLKRQSNCIASNRSCFSGDCRYRISGMNPTTDCDQSHY